MSVIHEALKRAERESAAGLADQLEAAGVSPAPPVRSRRPWVAAVLGGSILLLAGVLWTRHGNLPRAVPPAPGVATPVPETPLKPASRPVNAHTVEPISTGPTTRSAPAPAPPPAKAPGADSDPVRLNSQAVASFRDGRPEEARRLLEQALRLDPAMPEAHNNLGLVLRSQNRRAEAKEEFLRALELSPGYPEALNNLGLAWIEEGNQSEAIRSFEQALGANPAYSSAHLNLAIVHDRLGKRTEAYFHYRRFLDTAGAGESELVRRVHDRLRR
ncbi:MAG: tetratricopeptide repeat protein [Candidatus Methylomirabilia bacterium]